MSKFIGNLTLDFGDWGSAGRIAILMGDVVWICSEPNCTLVVTVHAGYMSDGASVPRWLWWFLPPWGDRETLAALVHDYLLDRLQGFEPGGPIMGAETRERCDRQFLTASLALGASPWRAYLAWLGVRSHSIWRDLTKTVDQPLTQ